MNTQSDNSKHESAHGSNHKVDPSQRSWFERNVNLIIAGLVLACILTLVAQWIAGPVLGMPFFDDHHPPHFEAEAWFGFQAIFGFVAFVTVVMLGTLLRPLIMRPEDYYDK